MNRGNTSIESQRILFINLIVNCRDNFLWLRTYHPLIQTALFITIVYLLAFSCYSQRSKGSFQSNLLKKYFNRSLIFEFQQIYTKTSLLVYIILWQCRPSSITLLMITIALIESKRHTYNIWYARVPHRLPFTQNKPQHGPSKALQAARRSAFQWWSNGSKLKDSKLDKEVK